MFDNSMSTLRGTSKKFGILVLCGGIYPEKIGGSEVHVFYTCSRLAERGHHVFVISSVPTLSSKTPSENIPFVKVSLKPWPTPFAALSYIIKSFMVSFKLRNQIDVVHAHIADCPMVAAFLFSLFSRKPYLITCHGSRIRISSRKFLHRIFQLPFLRNAKKISVVSSEIAELLSEKYGITRRKIVIIRNGYDEMIAQDSVNIGLCANDEKPECIICVANMRLEKDHKTLLKGFAKLIKNTKGIRLLLVGDGPLREQLEEFCTHQGLHGVEFLGKLPHKDVLKHVAKSDIFILTSIEEGMPNVIIEALSLGKPVVATRVGAIPEIVKDEFNGLLIPARSPKHVAKALERLLNDSELRRRLGKAAAESVKDYTWSKIAEKYEIVYQEALRLEARGVHDG